MPVASLNEVDAVGQGFAGGVNIRQAISELAPNEARKLENVVLDEVGGAVARLGSSLERAFGAGAVISQYVYYRAGLAPILLVQVADGFLYACMMDANAHITGSAAITSGVSTTQPLSFETYNGKCYFSNPVDGYFSYDGTTVTAFPSAPKAAFLRVWKDAMWATGIVGLESRVYESAAGDPETWPIANWVDISKGDGDSTTGLATDGSYLLVFKLRKYSVITDPVTFANHVVDFEKGCESHFAAIQFEGDVYFLSRRGICRHLGVDSPAMIVSGNLDPMFDPTVLNYAAMKLAWAYAAENRVGWCLPEVGFVRPNVQVEYYPRLGRLNTYGIRALGPFGFQRIPVYNIVSWRYNGQIRFSGGINSGVARVFDPTSVGDCDPTTHAQIPYDSVIRTGSFSLGAALVDKYLRRMRILGKGQITVLIFTNFETPVKKTLVVNLDASTDLWSLADVWGVGTWGPDSLFKMTLLNPDLYGKFFVFEFRSTMNPGVTPIGQKVVPVGSLEHVIAQGDMAIYGLYLEAVTMGVR